MEFFGNIHVSHKFYICIDNMYVKENFDIKMAILMLFTETFGFLKQISSSLFIFTSNSFFFVKT